MKEVLIFGASGYGKRVQYSLDNRKFKVNAFIDNNEEVQGKSINGIPVIAPAEVEKYNYDNIIISIALYEIEMKTQLVALGVSEDKIVTYQPNSSGILWQENRYTILRACIDEIIRNNVNGNIAELGVYKGEFAQYLNRFLPNKKLYLFDTFEGFDSRDENSKDDILSNAPSFSDTNIAEVISKMVNPDNVIIKKGYFPDTAIGLEEQFSLVSLDTDLYLPTIKGLEYFYPRLEHGGYIFIHDFDTPVWPGVKSAVTEYCTQNKVSYVPILDRCGSVIITK